MTYHIKPRICHPNAVSVPVPVTHLPPLYPQESLLTTSTRAQSSFTSGSTPTSLPATRSLVHPQPPPQPSSHPPLIHNIQICRPQLHTTRALGAALCIPSPLCRLPLCLSHRSRTTHRTLKQTHSPHQPSHQQFGACPQPTSDHTYQTSRPQLTVIQTRLRTSNLCTTPQNTASISISNTPEWGGGGGLRSD